MAGDGAIHASIRQRSGRWYGRLETTPPRSFSSATRAGCLSAMRRAAGRKSLTVEIFPEVVGVAEAAEIVGWDKRRVVTYLDRNAFPEPFASLASGRLWLRDDVESFAREWRKRRGAARIRKRR